MIFISSVRATLQAGPRRKPMQKRAKNACLFRLGPPAGTPSPRPRWAHPSGRS